MERSEIERTNFSKSKHGYTPEEVHRHLSAIADAFEKERSDRQAASAVAVADHVKQVSDAASTHIHSVIAAAERSAEEMIASAAVQAETTREAADREASEVRRRAEEEARHLTETTERKARELTERAEAQAAESRATVTAARSVVRDLGTSARSLMAELDAFEALHGENSLAVKAVAENQQQAPGPRPRRGKNGTTAEASSKQPSSIPAEAGVQHGETPPGSQRTGTRFRPGDERPQGADDQSPTGRSERMAMVAFDMVLRGASREEIADHLRKEFGLKDQQFDLLEATLDQAFAKGGNWKVAPAPDSDSRGLLGFLRR